MDERWTSVNEERDYGMFERLAHKTGWFSSWTRTPRYSSFDVDATGKNGKKVSVELKYRLMPHDEYDAYFIESDKLADGLLGYLIEGRIPLYINFFNDGKALIWNLAELKKTPIKDKRRRENYGTGMMDATPFYLLYTSEARVSTF